MKIKLAYGKNGLDIDLPDDWDVTILEPGFVQGLPDERDAVRAALQLPIAALPLAEYVLPSDRVGIIFNDITRATPNELIISMILEQIPFVLDENITLFDALGTHRENSADELHQLLGDELVERFRSVQNSAFDQGTQVYSGRTKRGNEIWLNREMTECDVIILTGFIEPHLFAGFSGGGKAIMPGMTGLETIMKHHTPALIVHPRANWGVTEGNPMLEEIMEIAETQARIYLLNVTLNKNQEITGVFAGDVREAHAAGCEFARETAMVAVDKPFDIVVTTNSGYPLDQNLYQAVKGMSAAAQIVCQGGSIVAVSECSDGIPDHGLYFQLLQESGSPERWLEMAEEPGFERHDQWQVQLQAQVCAKAQVYVFSDFLSDEQIEAAWFKPCRNLFNTIEKLKLETSGRIAILPEGPQTVPYLRG